MRVRAKVQCFVDRTLRDAGEEFEYAGPENGCLEVLDAPAKASPRPKGKTKADPFSAEE